ncbi:single-stranded-DNA-specific exonuclease RecJ [Candidatus Fermentibacteria bacterium]|nr:single-stranded-DNA-specific exonuclease RecJ [Candidatus Fermentibacteria bacterium]
MSEHPTREWRRRTPSGEARAKIPTDLRSLPGPVARLLLERGLPGDGLRRYLHGSLSDLSPWDALPNAAEAASIVRRTVEEGGRIMIHGDFDADGMTATAILHRTLEELGADVVYYVPDRLTEGYGMGPEGIRQARERGAVLVVTVDCGTGDLNAIRELRDSGVEAVVTDHHEPDGSDVYPGCVVNPKLAGDRYRPWSHLAGAGVALQIARGLLGRGARPDLIADLFQLAAVGTVCDVVPLTDDNRTMVREGIDAMRKEPLTGISALAAESGVDTGSMTTADIAFGLGPRLNACGRLARASLGIELLLGGDPEEARCLAGELNSLNSRRRKLEGELLREVLPAAADRARRGDRSLVLSDGSWHRGVLGIVSGRIASRFGLVSVLLSTEDGVGYGSARSVPGVPLHEVLADMEPLLLSYGGHAAAAGISVREEDIPAFGHALEKRLSAFDRGEFEPVLYLDGTLAGSDISLDTLRALDVMRPFGAGNEEPVWLVREAEIVDWRLVGRQRSHLSCEVIVDGKRIRAIGFGLAGKVPLLGSPVDLACRLREDLYRGGGRLQLHLVDLRTAQ